MTMELLLEQRGLMPALVESPDVYVVIGGPAERSVAFGAITALRGAGYRVDYPLRELGFGKQFKVAADSGAKLALIFGADEIANQVIKIRDLTTRSERDVPAAEIADVVREFFGGERASASE